MCTWSSIGHSMAKNITTQPCMLFFKLPYYDIIIDTNTTEKAIKLVPGRKFFLHDYIITNTQYYTKAPIILINGISYRSVTIFRKVR